MNNLDRAFVGTETTRSLYEAGRTIYREGHSISNCKCQHEVAGFVDALADDVKEFLQLRSTGL